MNERSQDQRFCSFISEHPHPLRKAKGCQFEGAPLYWAGDRTFCIFHLPLDTAITPHALASEGFGFAGTKRKWSAEENEDFAKYLKALTAASRQTTLDLTGVVFPSDSYFRETAITNGLLGECTFHKRSGTFAFIGTQFSGEQTSFQHSEFLSPALFTDARFNGGSVAFPHCRFTAGASFAGCRFPPKGAFFPDARFDGQASFTNAVFQRTAQFRATQFAAGADFSGSQLPGGADFRGVRFGGPVSFANGGETEADPRLATNGMPGENAYDFSGAAFENEVSFAGRKFGAPARFAEAQFHAAPVFHGASLREGSTFPPLAHFLSRGNSAEDESRYAALKHKAAEIHSAADREKFWVLEMMSRRRSGGATEGAAERAVHGLYERFSLYGSSIGRPLLWLALATLVFFPALYAGLFVLQGHRGPEALLRAVRFSFSQTFRPFSSWFDPGLFPPDLPTDLMAVVLAICGSVQSLVALGLAVLLVIAIQRRLRMA